MIKYITYKKKEYPVRVSYRIQKKLQELNRAKGDQEVGVEMYEQLLFEALKSGAHATDEKFDFKVENMEFVLDECYDEFKAMFAEFVEKMKVDTDKLEAPGEVKMPQK